MGKVASVTNDIKPAKEIVDEMVSDAADCLRAGSATVVSAKTKL